MSSTSPGAGTVDTNHLLDVWEDLCDPSLTSDDKLSRLFEHETEVLELPYGFLTRIDETADTQLIESAHGGHDLLQAGETAPLSETYCRETVRAPDGVFHVDNAAEEGWTDDPAYDRFGLGTYLGATVGSTESVYGTLCFASTEPRETAISDSERRFAKLLAECVNDVLRNRLTCSCGTVLAVASDPTTDGEVTSIVECENCGSEYAVTTSRLDELPIGL
ncbi:GAF domain-containing protein [Halobellus ordinarius]|uniref:GAF domain-containing protein n=1 Tax=Halobellus ordinarius TaxID=3075120 RepID=UPI002880B1CC|nr:GAF domain-containing protein [Halobellus sp. ZY16]